MPPTQAPVLQERSVRTSDAFFVNAGDSKSTREIKLTVEFPTQVQQDNTNDISLYFKRFATVLLAAHPSISILNWEHPGQNPVTKAIDIAPTEESIKQYFSGVVVQANRNKSKGFVKIQSATTFTIIKRNDRFWSWLTKNKVFVRTTQLAQSRHVNIGWMLHSHAEYSNQALAVVDLQRRMGREESDFELVPHSSSHMTSEGTKIITKSLKLRADYNSSQVIFRSVLERLKMRRDDPRLTAMSNTGDWKLIPFAQNTPSRDQMTEIIKKQNRYLHEMKAISFINLGSLEGSFRQDIMQDGAGTKRKNPDDTVEATTPVPNDDRVVEGAKHQKRRKHRLNLLFRCQMCPVAFHPPLPHRVLLHPLGGP